MGCGCKNGKAISSYIDLQQQDPQSPLDIVALASMNSTVGSFYNSSDYIMPSGSSVWVASPLAITGIPVVTANGTDNLQNVANAAQWNFSHVTGQVGSTIAPPVKKMVFMRAGIEWINTMIFSAPSSPAFTEFQLSMLENATTRGDAQGMIPVIRFNNGPYATSVGLALTIKRPGRFQFGLLGINNNSTPDYSMFELDIIVV